jgi:hypothetical protein
MQPAFLGHHHANAGTLFSPRLGEREKSSDDWFDPALLCDSRDDEFDMSDWLASRYGFLPVPIIITGPTLGASGYRNLLHKLGFSTVKELILCLTSRGQENQVSHTHHFLHARANHHRSALSIVVVPGDESHFDSEPPHDHRVFKEKWLSNVFLVQMTSL